MSIVSQFMRVSFGIPKWQHSPGRNSLNRFKSNFFKPININRNSPTTTFLTLILIIFL